MKGQRKSRTADFDLGAELLQRRCIFGEPLTQDDCAIWRGCTRQRIEQIENGALRKIRNRLRYMAQNDQLWDELMNEMFNRRPTAVPRATTGGGY